MDIGHSQLLFKCVVVVVKMNTNIKIQDRANIIVLHSRGHNISQIADDTGFSVSFLLNDINFITIISHDRQE